MKRRHHVFAAAGLLTAHACSSAPAAYRERATTSAVPPAETSTSEGAGTPPPAPSTSTTVTIAGMPATTIGTTTTTTLVLPERADQGLSDEQWWANQPGYPSGRCGGSLPPCWVMQRESGGSLTIVNPTTGAAGKWQFLPSTSRSMGYPRPMSEYDERTQDAAAERLWAGGSGCSAWSAC